MITCTKCHTRLQVKPEWSGKLVRCTQCKQVMKMPGAVQARIPVPSPRNMSRLTTVNPDELVSPQKNNAQSISNADWFENTISQAKDISQDELNFLRPSEHPGELGQLGSYRILKVLGRGGMGLVLLGRDTEHNRLVALKVIRPGMATREAKQRFLREANATKAINHSRVISIYEVGQDNGVPFLAMKYLTGKSLDDKLRVQQGPMHMAEAVRIAREIAEGLVAAHAKGLIHRDIKPSNVWLEDPHGQVCLLDFGLVRAMNEPGKLTRPGVLLGTPAYMSPEQTRSQPTDGRSDLFSLGCVLYQMCSGKRPFRGDDMISILMSVATEKHPPIHKLNPNVPKPLIQLIEQLLAKDRNKRPAAATVVIQQLDAIREKLTEPVKAIPVQAVTKKEPPANSGRRSKRLVLLIVGFVMLACLGGIVALMATRSSLKDNGKPDEVAAPKYESGTKVSENPKKKEKVEKIELENVHKHPSGMEFVRVLNATKNMDTFWKSGGGSFTHTMRNFNISQNGRVVHIPMRGYFQKLNDGSLGRPIDPKLLRKDLAFIPIQRGQYWMNISGRNAMEESAIPQVFYMGKFEVTQKEWQAIMGKNPSFFSGNVFFSKSKISAGELGRFPVERVSWNDVQLFLQKLNKLNKTDGWVYRLPTTTEWEYACREANSSKENCCFDFYLDKPTYPSIYPNLHPADANFAGSGLGRTQQVGKYQPNRLGIYDMHGNVWEWCSDVYHEPSVREIRGGGWNYSGEYCRAASRGIMFPDKFSYDVGFRVVAIPPSK